MTRRSVMCRHVHQSGVGCGDCLCASRVKLRSALDISRIARGGAVGRAFCIVPGRQLSLRSASAEPGAQQRDRNNLAHVPALPWADFTAGTRGSRAGSTAHHPASHFTAPYSATAAMPASAIRANLFIRYIGVASLLLRRRGGFRSCMELCGRGCCGQIVGARQVGLKISSHKPWYSGTWPASHSRSKPPRRSVTSPAARGAPSRPGCPASTSHPLASWRSFSPRSCVA